MLGSGTKTNGSGTVNGRLYEVTDQKVIAGLVERFTNLTEWVLATCNVLQDRR